MKRYLPFFIIIFILLYFFFSKTMKKIILPVNALVENNRMLQQHFDYYKHFNKYKIIITTLETRKIKFLDLHNKSVQYYCDKHGYIYDFRTQYNNSLELPVYWQKLQLVQDLLNSDCDYVLWLDSDSIICHPEIPLEYLISKNTDTSIFINKDFPCGINEPYCAGVFMIKNDTVGKAFINDCIETYINNEKCKKDGKLGLNGVYAGECYEQGTMNILLKSKYKNNMIQVSNDFIMNTIYPCYGTVILHFYDRNKDYGYEVFKTYYDNFVELVPNYKVDRNINIAILLTMYSKGEKRINMYSKNLKKWSNSGFDIYSVDSSGYRHVIPNINEYSFIQDENNVGKVSVSIREKESIVKCYDYFRDKFTKYDFIFKITGKYYIENLKEMLKYIPYDAEMVVQNQINTWGQNSEIVGVKPYILIYIMEQIKEEISFEQVLKNMIKSKKYKVYRMLPLKFNDKVQRSDGSYLHFL